MYTKEDTCATNISASLLKFFKIGLFETIYAKSGSNPDTPRNYDTPCGEAPERKCACLPETENRKCKTGDRGKTGAGVTGSRTGRVCEKEPDLPAGAVNPGLLRYIHNAARYRIPQCFEGGCVSVKQQSPKSNWILGHTLSCSSVSPGGYKVLLSYVDREKPTGIPYFVMEAAPGGQMSCEVRVGPTQSTRATVVAQIADTEFYSFESIFDAYFNSFTASVIAVNREFIALHYLQARNNYICTF
ncbi:unnamed protein product [Diatraea saccharalis]|uniref:Uncharacterized protein n=1 Tax=Diatraea saccharalis TaxID=40085 RepID=A0A9N9RHS4_9NEOP|nr:unnamed protein product [Diatraea saccharalis]